MSLSSYDAVRDSDAVMNCPSLRCAPLLPNSFPNAFPSLPSAGAVGPPRDIAVDGGATFAQFGWLGFSQPAGGEIFVCWTCGCWFVASKQRRKNVQVRAVDYAMICSLLEHRAQWQRRDDAMYETYLCCAREERFHGTLMRCDADGIPAEHYDSVKAKVDSDLERLNLEWETPILVEGGESSPSAPPPGLEYPDEWNWFVRRFDKVQFSSGRTASWRAVPKPNPG